MKKTIFSGIQPSGNLHLGNYIGAIRQWVKLQQEGEHEMFFCIVDLHAITVAQDPKTLRQKNRELAAMYVACGLDPEKITLFIQSENPDHPYLAWVFDCITPMGWMERMTQYKDKSTKQGQRTSVGLFHYPNLMAADILLYDTNLVPVGNDQTQHVELARDIAEKFNNQFGETFTIPQIMLVKHGARIMSLQNPTSKMSKSDLDPAGTINLLDDKEEIRRKIMRAVTDSGTEIVFSDEKPALSNLLSIFAECTDMSIEEIEKKYHGVGYGEFKNDLATVVIDRLGPIQERFKEISGDEKYLDSILDKGAAHAREKSSQKVARVRELVGLGRA